MLAIPMVNNAGGGTMVPIGPGDTLNLMELPAVAVDGTSAFSYAAGDIAKSGVLRISGGAAVAGTLPTADQLVKALIGALGQKSPPNNALYGTLPQQNAGPFQWPANMGFLPPGSTFRRRFINENSNTVTQTAPSSAGVTISGTATIATDVWREYLIQILNSSPACTIPCTTTNNSKVLSNVDLNLISQVTVGMSVYGTGIGASAKVAAVNLDAGTITTDVNSTATADNIAVSFTPTVVYYNIGAGDK